MFKVNNKDNQNDNNGVVLVSLLLTLNIFHSFYVSINFKQVNGGWVISLISHLYETVLNAFWKSK